MGVLQNTDRQNIGIKKPPKRWFKLKNDCIVGV